jgi:hypothetical protein
MKVDDGDSGSWVMKGNKLCGYIFSRVHGRPWAYMLPISTVFEEISGFLSTKLHSPVLLPTVAEINQKKNSTLRPEKSVTFSTETAQQNPAPDANAENHPSNPVLILPGPSTTSRQVDTVTLTKTTAVPKSKSTIVRKEVPYPGPGRFSTRLRGARNFLEVEVAISTEEKLPRDNLLKNTAREKTSKLQHFGRWGAGNRSSHTKNLRGSIFESERPNPKGKLKAAAKSVGRACIGVLNLVLCIMVTDDFKINV